MTQHDYTSRLCSNQYTSMTLLIKTSKRMALCMQVSEGVFVYVYLSIDLPAKGAGGQQGGGALQQANAPVPDHLSRQFPLGRRACGILEAILAGITARQWDLGRQLAYRMAKARGLLAGAFIRPSPRPSRAWGSRGSGRCRGGGGLDELGRQMGVGLLGTPWLSRGLSKLTPCPPAFPPPRRTSLFVLAARRAPLGCRATGASVAEAALAAREVRPGRCLVLDDTLVASSYGATHCLGFRV